MEQMHRMLLNGSKFFIQMDPDEKQPAGWVAGPGRDAPVAFSNLNRLILLLDRWMEQGPPEGAPDCVPPAGWQPELELEILLRENHSWQGWLRRLDKKQEASFRSVLELLLLFDSLLEADAPLC